MDTVKTGKEEWKKAEEAFIEILNDEKIPFIYLEQGQNTFAEAFRGIEKRPDFLLLLKSPVFVDVKTYFQKAKNKAGKDFGKDRFYLGKDELTKLTNLQNLHGIPVWMAFTLPHTDVPYRVRHFNFVPISSITDTEENWVLYTGRKGDDKTGVSIDTDTLLEFDAFRKKIDNPPSEPDKAEATPAVTTDKTKPRGAAIKIALILLILIAVIEAFALFLPPGVFKRTAENPSGTVTANVNVRKGPASTYEIQDVVKEKQEVIILEREGAWVKIRYGDGKTGFISGEFLKERRD
jgi:hypothetical protein